MDLKVSKSVLKRTFNGTAHLFYYHSNSEPSGKIWIGGTNDLDQKLTRDKEAYKRHKAGNGEWKPWFQFVQHDDVDMKILDTYTDLSLKIQKARRELCDVREHVLRIFKYDVIDDQLPKSAVMSDHLRVHPQKTKLTVTDTCCQYCGKTMKPKSLKRHQNSSATCLRFQGKPSQYIGKRGYCNTCGARATFGLPGQAPTHCKIHSIHNERDVISRRCAFPGCLTRPSYGLPGEIRIHCSAHAQDGEVNTRNKRCSQPGCNKQPSYGLPGQCPLHCIDHAEDGEENVRKSRCVHPNCKTQPSFALIGKRPIHCSEHAEPGEEDVCSKRCVHTGCDRFPCYGKYGDKPVHCKEHAEDSEEDVHNRHCTHTGCSTRASYGFSGQLAIHCSEHAKDGEEDVVNKRCQQFECKTLQVADGFCTIHHPEYIPSTRGVSKTGCEFIDAIGAELSLTKIQHRHYDKVANTLSGSEFVIPTTLYRADGFFTLQNAKKPLPFAVERNGVVLEFHGHLWHGYPDGSKSKECNYFGANFGKLHSQTMERMHNIKSLGFTVVYIWESDFIKWKKQRTGQSLFRFCHVM